MKVFIVFFVVVATGAAFFALYPALKLKPTIATLTRCEAYLGQHVVSTRITPATGEVMCLYTPDIRR